jgi:hypothetical protein
VTIARQWHEQCFLERGREPQNGGGSVAESMFVAGVRALRNKRLNAQGSEQVALDCKCRFSSVSFAF